MRFKLKLCSAMWLCLAASSGAAAVRAADAPVIASSTKAVSWDEHSLMINGHREFIWSGEFHPFRLPDTNAWRDVYRKMKASGFNTVALYFNWGYHSPAPGAYDFTGIRDMDLAIRMAEEEGLYVIVRPGPYINAEVSRGGFPGYLARQTGVARTMAPDYLKEADDWLTHINAIIARHQISRGGKVILYQVENELFDTSDEHRRYMDHLIKKARADGIDVPLFHNSPNSLPNWVPQGSETYYTVAAPGLDLYAFDGYPGGSCNEKGEVGAHNPAPNNGIYSTTQPQIGSLASPKTPGFAAEYGAGWFDYWGSVGNYECNAKRLGPGYVRTFYGANIINRVTIHNIYMAFGGTSWGWMPASVVYTSYDYGAPISETRQLRDKAYTLKQLGQFTQAAEPLLTHMDKAEPLYPTSDKVKLYHNAGPAGHLVFAIHEPHDGMGDDAFKFRLTTKAGSYLIPQQGTLRLKGQDAKLLLADYGLERQKLVYTTSDLQTHLQQGATDIALLYGRVGEDGETVLRFKTKPKVEVIEGLATTVYDAKTGDLRLNYQHKGLIRLRITGDAAPLLLLIGEDAETQKFWRQETDKGPVLQRTSAIVKGAVWDGERLNLTGEGQTAEAIEVWATAKTLTFNGTPLDAHSTASGSLLTSYLAEPKAVVLPDLMAAQWTIRWDSREADPAFDDSAWRVADLKVSAATVPTQPPPGQPVLAMSDYGFHQGDVWYRGRLTARTTQKKLELTYGGGAVGLVQVWIDGRFVGQNELPGGFTYPKIPTVGKASFDVDLKPGTHQISVMVRNMSHNWDLFANEEHKEGRGLISASLSPDETQRFTTPITWKIQGQGETMDPVRGTFNNGGLYGERKGWHLPDARPDGWTPANVTAAPPAPGTYWLRTAFKLDLPKDVDTQLALVFGDPTQTKTDRHTRVLIFVNGWHAGNYVSNVGPQNTFVIPPAFLNPNGANTIALAVTTDGKPGNALEGVKLVDMRQAR
ncbi:beta-galactosidase [Asticcacaulis sp. BYS171W]|uniref:beta-galactosidase n=1 Tax=Asticcacaulis aquaticus TaxID=2984212 RepID=A0ABT5HQ94_9CAUL|nr:beta-galactosidase [Asticcacaulis aquaticus]MDC7682118.1 beta-galactosidase [Asticcacaulis aquaticus]